jgi:hypothetical protein
MVTMTLTEFNRNPSAAARLARRSPVIVTERGVAAFEYRAIAPASSRLDQLIAEGRWRAPQVPHGPLRHADITVSAGRELYEAWEQEDAERDL